MSAMKKRERGGETVEEHQLVRLLLQLLQVALLRLDAVVQLLRLLLLFVLLLLEGLLRLLQGSVQLGQLSAQHLALGLAAIQRLLGALFQAGQALVLGCPSKTGKKEERRRKKEK